MPRLTHRKPVIATSAATAAETPALRSFMAHHLSRLINLLNLRLLEHLRPLDLTLTQFRVMQMLNVRGAASIAELTRDAVIEQSIISRAVDQFEERGYATRSPRQGNARVMDVRLTSRGAAVCRELMPLAQAIVKDAFGVLSPDERHFLEHVLERMFAHAMTPGLRWLRD